MSQKQIVFFHHFESTLPESPSSGEYRLFWAAADAVCHVRLLVQALGWMGACKAVLKMMSGRRKFYLVTERGAWVHWGWISISFCHYYPVQPGEVVIGPIETTASVQGRGFATFALIKTINRLIEKGYPNIYIDTDDHNFSCLKVIEKCRFGAPHHTFIKTENDK